MLRKNHMKIINDAPISKPYEIPLQKNSDIIDTQKLNNKPEKRDRDTSSTQSNKQSYNRIIPKKEDAINNIRLRGIYERDPQDKTSP